MIETTDDDNGKPILIDDKDDNEECMIVDAAPLINRPAVDIGPAVRTFGPGCLRCETYPPSGICEWCGENYLF